MSSSVHQFLRSKEHQSLSGRIRPSGRFSYVQIFPKKSKGFSDGNKKTQAAQPMRSVSDIDRTYSEIRGGHYSPMREMPPRSPGCFSNVGLSDAPISPIRAGRGSKGIGSRQRDILCWGAATLERIYGRANLSFLTLTLPPMDAIALQVVKDNWSDIVNRVQLRIKEKLHNVGIETSIAGCVELQLERYESTGMLYPHLHMVFRGKQDARSHWAIKPHQYRQIWRRCIGKFLPDRVLDWRASENVQPVRKSVAGYLAKYVSKCASKSEPGILDNWHPRDWILLSRRVRALYERMSVSGYDIAMVLDKVVRSWRPDFGYVNRVFISTPAYGERCIGFAGWLKNEVFYPSYLDVHGIT